MPLTQEEINDLKDQLRQQVAHLPPDKKTQALEQIESLSPQALEAMLMQQQSKQKSTGPEKNIFRMIVDKDIPSVMVDENSVAVAVLDIAPISKGHIIIIPKKPVSETKEIPTLAFSLAKKLANKLTTKLNAKASEIQTESKFNEAILNVIPYYKEPLNINSPRSKSTVEELEKIAPLIKAKQKPKIEKIKINTKKSSSGQVLKISRRIP